MQVVTKPGKNCLNGFSYCINERNAAQSPNKGTKGNKRNKKNKKNKTVYDMPAEAMSAATRASNAASRDSAAVTSCSAFPEYTNMRRACVC